MLDLKNPSDPIVAKVSQHHQNFETEFNALNIIYEVNKGLLELHADNIEGRERVQLLQPIKSGLLFQSPKDNERALLDLMEENNNQVTLKEIEGCGTLSQYIIMPRLGTNLSDYFNLHNYTLSKVSIYDLGI